MLEFESKEAISNYLNVQARLITTHLAKWKIGGINGYYLFSKELNNIEKEKLIQISKLRKFNNCEVWVYDAKNINNILGTFKSIQKAADQFNVDYRTILKHLDTNKVTIKNDKLVLFFSKKLKLTEIENIKIKNIKNETRKLWIYKKIKNELILFQSVAPLGVEGGNTNEPTFNSINIASKELNISYNAIIKYLDTNKSYNELFFYSEKL